MTAFLIDQMFPAAAASMLRDTYSHDAIHVTEAGLRGAPDTQVAATARADSRAVLTENVTDFCAEHDVVLVFISKKNLPRRRCAAAGSAWGGGTAHAVPHLRWRRDQQASPSSSLMACCVTSLFCSLSPGAPSGRRRGGPVGGRSREGLVDAREVGDYAVNAGDRENAEDAGGGDDQQQLAAFSLCASPAV